MGRHAAAELFFEHRVAARHREELLRASDRVERDRLGRSGEPARLRAHGARPPRSLGSGRSQTRPRGEARRENRVSDGEPEPTARRWTIRCVRRAREADARRTSSASAPGCRCANTATTRRSTSPSSAPAPAAARWPAGWRKRLLGRGARRRPVSGVRWRISPRTRCEQTKLYWTDERIVDGENPLQLGIEQ